jgi:hypothetical protein
MAVVSVQNRKWEDVFATWSEGPSATERERCENAERMVKKAIAASEKLAAKQIDVFVQGSYRHRTNVRKDSDVDVCVRLRDTISTELDNGLTDADFGYSTAPYQFPEFKNDVEAALKNHFGASSVARGKKAFDVHANTYRVDADVVPVLEYRWHFKDGDGAKRLIEGTALFPDGGLRILNFPDQSYANGVSKNDATNRKYKRGVRILKRLRNEMAENGLAAAKNMPSFLVDCLLWNVPDESFDRGAYKADMRAVLAHLFNNTRKDEDCAKWLEVNGIKFLFHLSQPWTREAAHQFVSAAWDYIGFEN